MPKLTIASLQALQQHAAQDDACDALLAGLPPAPALRERLRALLQAQLAFLQAEHEVTQVSDLLRRDQKYAPAGPPSVHIVGLRKQQAATKQTLLVARAKLAQVAQTFVQASNLPLRPKQTPSEATIQWLQKR